MRERQRYYDVFSFLTGSMVRMGIIVLDCNTQHVRCSCSTGTYIFCILPRPFFIVCTVRGGVLVVQLVVEDKKSYQIILWKAVEHLDEDFS